jgi:16S rRNA (guanine966-N2)-methyltransferase
MAMRITGGRLRGRPLFAPQEARVRPTSDKVRQAIFNLLQHHPELDDFSLEGARVLDLFAGAATLGLEALSRNAAYCLFVDDAADSRALIRRNVEALDLTGSAKIWRRNAAALGRLATLAPFDLAFLDPPYRHDLIEPALGAMSAGGWLVNGAIIVAESDEHDCIAPPGGYLAFDRRTYGGTVITLLRYELAE